MYLHHSDVFSALDAVSWKATGKDQQDGETTPELKKLPQNGSCFYHEVT